MILSRRKTSDRPTHPEPSRSLVGRLLNLNPLQRHIVDGTFLNFLPPVLHRALKEESVAFREKGGVALRIQKVKQVPVNSFRWES